MTQTIPRRENPLFYNLNSPEDVQRMVFCAIDFLMEVQLTRKDAATNIYMDLMRTHLTSFRGFFEGGGFEAIKGESIADLLAEVQAMAATGTPEEDDEDGEDGE